MNKLCYGIRHPNEVNKYYNQPKTLGLILQKIKELGMVYFVCQKGEPTLRWNGSWEPYIKVSKLDKRLLVEGLV